MSGQQISDYLTEYSYLAIRNVVWIFLSAVYPQFLLQRDRLNAFNRRGLVGPVYEECAKLGFFPLEDSDDGVACFSCGFKCKASRVCRSVGCSYNRLNCPLQAARCPERAPMKTELLEESVCTFLPTNCQLEQIRNFQESTTCYDVLAQMRLPPDAIVFCAATLLIVEQETLLNLQPGVFVDRIYADSLDESSLLRFPVLDEASTFAGDFRVMVAAGPGYVQQRNQHNIDSLLNRAVMAT